MSDLMLVYWDAGHGGSDPGAVKYETERDLNIKVVNYGCAYMEENYQCEVYKDISADSINTICKRANSLGAALMLSVHFNAGKGNGGEALVYSIKNKELGKLFDKYVSEIGQNSRGVKYRPDLGILRLTKMPAVLYECAFVDNWDDIKDWNDDAELKAMGIALAKAAADYLGLPLKKKASKTPFRVKVTADALNIRAGVGTKYKKVGMIKDNGVYTIIEVHGNWGKLKSSTAKSPRWIHLGYTKKL